MKNQESLDKQLKQKLSEAKMTPPAMLFDQILEEVAPAPPSSRPFWHFTVRSKHIAASVAILFVAAVAWFAWPESKSGSLGTIHLSAVDSFSEESLDRRLSILEFESALQKAGKADNIDQRVQPEATSVRLANMKADITTVEMQIAREDHAGLAHMVPIQAFIPRHRALQQQIYAATRLYASIPEAMDEQALETIELPSLRDTYTMLSDRKLLIFARRRLDEFASKEHYLSFNLGNIEFGQTIQLIKKQYSN